MKIDQFMMLPMMSVGLASTTFTGQNVGASYIDRAKKGATTAFLLAELVTIVMMIPLLIFAPQMVYLFNQEAAVIRYGTLFLYLLSPFYILCCVNQNTNDRNARKLRRVPPDLSVCDVSYI